MTARDNGTTRVGGGWCKGASKGVYELADGTARVVKMLDTERYRWWAWSIKPTSDIEKFRTLREAKQHIEKMRADDARLDNDYRTIAIGLLNRWVLDGPTQEEKQRRTDMTWRVMEELEADRDGRNR